MEKWADRSRLKIAADIRKTSTPLKYKDIEVGAGGRTRTGTLSPAVDFEWLRHVCPPQFSAVLRRRKPLRQQAFLQ